jgi:SAM-dependent methyltransferase
MRSSPSAELTTASDMQAPKRVLNAGSGSASARRLHPCFQPLWWDEVRLDIDPAAEPDLLGSFADMRQVAPSQSFDAVWASHSLEHLAAHEVAGALLEFRRILRPTGFALVTSPDLEAIAGALLRHGLDHIAYVSPMGPITPLDMLYGHAASIERGMAHMAHRSGFTCASLGASFLEAGFPMVFAKRDNYDLWGLALMEDADSQEILAELRSAGLNLKD